MATPNQGLLPNCPSEAELSAFSSGKLKDEALSTLALHLSQCETCSRALQQTAAGDESLAMRLRDALRQAGEQDESLGRNLRALLPDGGALESTISMTQGGLDSVEVRDRPVPMTGSLPAPQSQPTHRDEPAPRSIGRYQIQSVLGRGNFGTVYLALDPLRDRQVAIKVPQFQSGASADAVCQFVSEARNAARLSHRGIVAVHDVEAENGEACFIAMEYVAGRSLREELKAGKVALPRAVEIVIQAASAVHYAHKNGVVHRDLKPANLLLGEDGRVKVADFGLAMHEDEQWERAGEQAGTLAYMSPEQVRGDAHRLDGRSDVWSLGVILYELLTGRRPFFGTPAQIQDEILHRLPKPPRQIDDSISPELEQICLRCLSREPTARYQTAHDLAAALKQSQNPRRLRWLRTLALAAAGAVLLVSSFLLASRGRAPLPEATAALAVDRLAEPGEWVTLLDRNPFNKFPGRSDGEIFNLAPDKQQLAVDSSEGTLLMLGETKATDFVLSLDVAKLATNGQCGVFIGLFPTEPEGKRAAWSAHLWRFIYHQNEHRYVMQRHTLNVIEFSDHSGGISSYVLGPLYYLPPSRTMRGVLEIVVKGDEVHDVRWMGVSIPELTDAKRTDNQRRYTYRGEFGIANSYGSSIFRNGKFMRIQRDGSDAR